MRINNNLKSCAFTGHRPNRFVFGYDETHPMCIKLKETITKEIESLIKKGVYKFYTGCALGVDLWAGEAVLSLKQTYPDIELHSIIPFKGQEANWAEKQKVRYYNLLNKSDNIKVLNECYRKDCFLDRNRYLVDHADILLAVYDRDPKSSGTGYTVNYASAIGKTIILIDPDDFHVEESWD